MTKSCDENPGDRLPCQKTKACEKMGVCRFGNLPSLVIFIPGNRIHYERNWNVVSLPRHPKKRRSGLFRRTPVTFIAAPLRVRPTNVSNFRISLSDRKSVVGKSVD